MDDQPAKLGTARIMGDEFEFEVFIEQVLHLQEPGQENSQVASQVSDRSPFDDVVVRHKDRVVGFQAKHAASPNDRATIDWLCEPAKSGSLPLIRQWAEGATRVDECVIISNRRPDAILARAIKDGRLSLHHTRIEKDARERLVGASGMKRGVLVQSLKKIRFDLGAPDHKTLREQNDQRMKSWSPGEAISRVRETLWLWARKKDRPNDGGWVTRADLRELLKLDLEGLDQQFLEPEFGLVEEPSATAGFNSFLGSNARVLVVHGTAGVGKSSFVSHVIETKGNHWIAVRHHFYLGSGESHGFVSGARVNRARISASIVQQLRNKFPSFGGGDRDLARALRSCAEVSDSPIVVFVDGLDDGVVKEMEEVHLRALLTDILDSHPDIRLVVATQPQVREKLPEACRGPGTTELEISGFTPLMTANWLERIHEADESCLEVHPDAPAWRDYVQALHTACRGHPLVLAIAVSAARASESPLNAEHMEQVDPKNRIKSYVGRLLDRMSTGTRCAVATIASVDLDIPVERLGTTLGETRASGVQHAKAMAMLLAPRTRTIRFRHPVIGHVVREVEGPVPSAPPLRRLLRSFEDHPDEEFWDYPLTIQLMLAASHDQIPDIHRGDVEAWVARGRSPSAARRLLEATAQRHLQLGADVDMAAFAEVAVLHDYLASLHSIRPEILIDLREASFLCSGSRVDYGDADGTDPRWLELDLRIKYAEVELPSEKSWSLFLRAQEILLGDGELVDRSSIQLRTELALLALPSDEIGTTGLEILATATTPSEIAPARLVEIFGMRGMDSWLDQHLHGYMANASPDTVFDGAIVGQLERRGVVSEAFLKANPEWGVLLDGPGQSDARLPSSFSIQADPMAGNQGELAAQWRRAFWCSVAARLRGIDLDIKADKGDALLPAMSTAAQEVARVLRGGNLAKSINALESWCRAAQDLFHQNTTHAMACRSAAEQVSFLLMRVLAATRPNTVEAFNSSVLAPALVRSFADGPPTSVPYNVIQTLIKIDEALDEIDGSFWELAERRAKASLAAAKAGLYEESIRQADAAASLSLLHGDHKDMFLFGVLDGLEAIAGHASDIAAENLSMLMPYLMEPRRFSDGDETNHLPAQFLETASAVSPELVLKARDYCNPEGDSEFMLDTLVAYLNAIQDWNEEATWIAGVMPDAYRRKLSNPQTSGADPLLGSEAFRPPESSSGTYAPEPNPLVEPTLVTPNQLAQALESLQQRASDPWDFTGWLEEWYRAHNCSPPSLEAIKNCDVAAKHDYHAELGLDLAWNNRPPPEQVAALIDAYVENHGWNPYWTRDSVKEYLIRRGASLPAALSWEVFVKSNPAVRTKYPPPTIVGANTGQYAKFLVATGHVGQAVQFVRAIVREGLKLIMPLLPEKNDAA